MWTGILVPLAPFIMIIFVIWFGSQVKKTQARHRAEMQKDLLTKFSSGQELAEFLKTDGGKLFMPEPARTRSPAHRAGAGILVLVIGVGLIAASTTHPPDVEFGNMLRVAGYIVIAAGVGLLISAFVTQRLARKWSVEDQKTQ